MPHLNSRMPHHLVAPLLSVVLASCSNDASGPSDRVLVGSWGSPETEFIAIQAGAEARTGCTTIVIQAPVTLAENNTFTSRGELHGSGAVIGKLPVVEVFGTLTEDGLSLAAPSVAGGAPVTYLLKAGVTRSPADVPECLQ